MRKKVKIKDEEVKEVNTISNNVFYGVHWDATAIEGINDVAKALLNLTQLYKSQNITVGPMISISK